MLMHRDLLSTWAGSLAAFGIAVVSAVTPVAAACLEDVGCTNDHYIPYPVLQGLSCDSLWTVRNTIFHENGFCFRTTRALAVFSNEGCSYHVSGEIPLNPFEQGNISRVITVERQKACH
jgi:hypothetical protein